MELLSSLPFGCSPWLAIQAPEHNTDTAYDCHSVAHFVSTEQFRQNLEVHKRGRSHLCPPGIFALLQPLDREISRCHVILCRDRLGY
jgi:hypothetical protein